MAQLPQASPENSPALLGCPGQVVHQGQYPTKETPSLHSTELLDRTPGELHSAHWGIEKIQLNSKKQYTGPASMQILLC